MPMTAIFPVPILCVKSADSSGSRFRLGDLCVQCDQGFSEGITLCDLDDFAPFGQCPHDETLPSPVTNLDPPRPLNPFGNVWK